MGDSLRIARVCTSGAAAATWLFRAAARSSVLVAKIVALVSILFGLLVAFGQFILLALGAPNSGSLSGSLIYFVGNLLLAWGICMARPVRVGLAGKGAAAATFMFIVLMVVITFVNLVAVVTLVSEADSGYLIYGIVTVLLAGGIYRAKSVASLSVMLLLAVFAFIPLTVGGFYSSYDGAPRSDGPAGALLADLVTDLRKEHKLVGLAAMVMVDGKVMSSAADGERKKGSGVPLELGDRWHLGSITKSITATMIGRLVESGQMKWTDTIGERFSDASIHEDWKPVTLQQLLTHTSGAPANFSLGVSLKKPAPGPECTRERRQAVMDVIAEKPAHRAGETFAYSNVGYTIAGAMAEAATGVNWEDLVKREVFEPLALNDAGFGPPKSPSKTLDQPRGHHAYGWKKRSASDEEDNTPIMGPANAVHMTLGNLCNYGAEHLRGELGTGKLLAAETCKRLHTPKLHDYACGWVVKQPNDEIPHTVYWHNGSNTMWYALVVFIPGKNMVVAVTSNDGDIRQAESAAWKVVKACANQFNVEGDAARRKSLVARD
jgi:CubicO group peptidase (beta-lactamase class C family)